MIDAFMSLPTEQVVQHMALGLFLTTVVVCLATLFDDDDDDGGAV